MESKTPLEEAAEARKARLLALRRHKAGESVDGTPGIILKRRNFDPELRTLRKHVRTEIDDTVEKNVEGLAEKIIAEDEATQAQDLDVFNIAPKRPNWDLKRDLQRKLAKLERRYQQAIHTLIRERLISQKGDSEDIVGAMNAQEKQNAVDSPSDDEEEN